MDEFKTAETSVAPVAPAPVMAPVSTPSKPADAAPIAESGTVVLSTEAFNALMARVSDLEKTSELVLQVQDRNKIKKIEDMRRAGKLVKSVKIRQYQGEYIVGWQTMQDEVYKDSEGRLVEKQVVRAFLENDTKVDMSMRQWADASQYIEFEVTKESKDSDGNLFFTCVGPDGKTIEINSNFIN